ncbi:MAG TPA: 4Fe-4S binding protein, partial [Thermodesulfobacteriota bacterium]|nr:4Fe-4S binding protein [Thermodesulfobacteriota bacterium]
MLFQVDEDKCLRDGLCVQDCRLIEMKDPDSIPTPISGAEELCSHCGHCVAVCPTGALALHNLNLEDCTEMKKELIINAD